MSRDNLPTGDDDLLLQRYREANALDVARPGAALRDQVLAQARSVAQARTPTPPQAKPGAANDSVWHWKAFGGLAVLGLVGLLVLQFERGSPDEREAALGTSVPRSAAPAEPTASASAPIREAAPATSDANISSAPTAHAPAPASAPPVPPRAAPARLQPPGTTPSDNTASAPEPPAAIQAPAPAKTPAVAAEAETPAAIALPAAPAALSKAAPAAAPMSASPTPPAAASDAARSGTGGVARESARTRNEVSAEALRAPPPPLHQATVNGDTDSVRRLLAQGADVNGRDASGRSALMLAAQRGDAALAKLLLDAGANALLRDPQGRSAADLAEQAGHPALLPLLR